ncbi:hypothetical protein PR202_gb08417 [Eleusine coracana subsp. coracana]|uniref:Uncharacterized protein n=1 Tax=Eleusine coracana subsp. coracana TaxID=191504 RepID=A0AAV5EEK5_ELECO|nr:hypothetical protein PR202_gb08417 [Eleusine coracana subsp. coracana]
MLRPDLALPRPSPRPQLVAQPTATSSAERRIWEGKAPPTGGVGWRAIRGAVVGVRGAAWWSAGGQRLVEKMRGGERGPRGAKETRERMVSGEQGDDWRAWRRQTGGMVARQRPAGRAAAGDSFLGLWGYRPILASSLSFGWASHAVPPEHCEEVPSMGHRVG